MKIESSTTIITRRRLLQGASLALGAGLVGGCKRTRSKHDLCVGYLNNLTHGQALLMAHDETWRRRVPKGVRFMAFGAGPALMEALAAGAVDMGYVGPAPAINAFVRSGGRRLQILAGATDGGASLIVRKGSGIKRLGDLKGKRLAATKIGSTQDVSLRFALRRQGIRSTQEGGQTLVTCLAMADASQLLRRGHLDGVWAPEPWASRMIHTSKGSRLLDERSLWPKGGFPTAVLIATPHAQHQKARLVRQMLGLHQELTAAMAQGRQHYGARVGAALSQVYGRAMVARVLEDAWASLSPATSVSAGSLTEISKRMRALGYLPAGSLQGLVAPGAAALTWQAQAPASRISPPQGMRTRALRRACPGAGRPSRWKAPQRSSA